MLPPDTRRFFARVQRVFHPVGDAAFMVIR